MDGERLRPLLECAARDTDLLEESLCDLVVAFGGTAQASHNFYQQQLQLGVDLGDFNGRINTRRLRYFRKMFTKLDLPAPALLRVLYLHLKRGAALLRDCPQFLKTDPSLQHDGPKNAEEAAGDADMPVVTTLNDVADLPRESLVDLVEGRHVNTGTAAGQKSSTPSQVASPGVKLFCQWYVDAVLDLYEEVLKRVCELDLYDCIRLRCFFVNLDDILVTNGVQHVGVRNEVYELMLKLLRFALSDAWWVHADPGWLKARLPFISEMKGDNDRRGGGVNPTKLDLDELKFAIIRVGTVSGQHGALGFDLFREINRVFDLKHAECDMWQQLMGNAGDESERHDEFVMFKRVIHERQHSWVDVLTAALVTIAYSVLFEAFVRQLDMINTKSDIPAVLARLEMLSDLVELLHETDVGYTAWAVDLLGPRADAKLMQAFRMHGDFLIKGDDGPSSPALKRLKWGEGILVYIGTLQRINRMFHRLVSNLVDCISKPAIDELEKIWGSKLWWEILYSRDKLLIGPRGAVREMVGCCNKRVRDAISVELFARVIACFCQKVVHGYFDSEQTIFNALAIWESFCALNLYSADVQNNNYHINKLFEMVEKIKMGVHVDPVEPLECLRDFWTPLLSCNAAVVDANAQYTPLDLSYYVLQDLTGMVLPDNRVWIGGLLRNRVALFGNVILIFKDESALQPVGMIDMERVSAVFAANNNKRSTLRLDVSESDGDLYSCGTTDTEAQTTESPPRTPYLPVGGFDKSVLYWGWRLRLEIGGINPKTRCDPLNEVDVRFEVIDFEFMGPEHRERWSRSLKATVKPNSDTHKQLWWPKHSMMFTDERHT